MGGANVGGLARIPWTTKWRPSYVGAQESAHAAAESAHAAVESAHAAAEWADAAVESAHAAVESVHAAVESAHAAAETSDAEATDGCRPLHRHQVVNRELAETMVALAPSLQT